MTASPTITISVGDPAGIGPEVVVKALAGEAVCSLANWIVIGDHEALAPIEAQTDIRLSSLVQVTLQSPGSLKTIPPIGQLNADCGRAALAYVRRAAELCLRGEADISGLFREFPDLHFTHSTLDWLGGFYVKSDTGHTRGSCPADELRQAGLSWESVRRQPLLPHE